MITLFTTAKPFRGHIAIIQRNAIHSWTLLHPECEIILFGDDEGTAEIASEFGLRHIPDVACNEHGTPLLSAMFDTAQQVATHSIVCYINADIILMSDFVAAVRRIPLRRFLMVGQRWDVDVDQLCDFSRSDWEIRIREQVSNRGSMHPPVGIDYFVFPRGIWHDIPPFAIARTTFDNWLIYAARSLRTAVIDATQVVMAVHQNHDLELWRATGSEAKRNLALAGGSDCVFTLKDATHILTSQGLKRQKITMEGLRRYFDTLPVLSPRIAPYAPYLRLVNKLLSPRSAAGAIKQKLRKFL